MSIDSPKVYQSREQFVTVAPKALGLPPGLIGIALTLFLFGLFSPNVVITWLAALVLLVGAAILWRPGESPILLFVFAFQWLQACMKLLHANWRGVYVGDLAEFRPSDVETSIMLSLIGLFFLALGLRLGSGPWRPWDAVRTRETVLNYSPSGFFKLYVIAAVIATIAQSASSTIPGLSQPLQAFANLKWAFYWMLAYATFSRSSHYKYWLIAFGVEMALSMGSYFSDFKTPLFFTLIAAAAAQMRVSFKQVFVIVLLSAMTLSLGIVWTAIKKDYRFLVSEGQGQVVNVDYYTRIAKIDELISHLEEDDIEEATENLANRLSYVDFFAVVLTVVPSVKPHEYGALWKDALLRPVMPRILFPKKAVIDDSARTNYYTGLGKYGRDRGTSISIGYMAESYIDFGPIGMMLPIFALGLFLGYFYRWMLRLEPSRLLLGMALATATIYEITFLEASNAKLVGAVVVMMLASWVCMRFIAPRYLSHLRTKAI